MMARHSAIDGTKARAGAAPWEDASKVSREPDNGGPDRRKDTGKGSDCPNDADRPEKAREARRRRFQLRASLRSAFEPLRSPEGFLPRVGQCGWGAAGGSVTVSRGRGKDGRTAAWFGGVTTCASVWCCAVCAAKILAVRSAEVAQASAWAERQGADRYLVTLTIRHRRADDLAAMLDGLARAWKRTIQGRWWQEFRERLAFAPACKVLDAHACAAWRAEPIRHRCAHGWRGPENSSLSAKIALSADAETCAGGRVIVATPTTRAPESPPYGRGCADALAPKINAPVCELRARPKLTPIATPEAGPCASSASACAEHVETCERPNACQAKRPGARAAYIRRVELTHGPNGWHPHLHVQLYATGPNALGGRDWMVLSPRWRRAGARELGPEFAPSMQHGLDLRLMSPDAPDYIVKDAVTELTAHDTKVAERGHRSLWHVARDAAEPGPRQEASAALWREVYTATKGHRLLTWSGGFRQMAGVGEELTDEEAIAEDVGTIVAQIPREDWIRIRRSPAFLCGVLEDVEAGRRTQWDLVDEAPERPPERAQSPPYLPA